MLKLVVCVGILVIAALAATETTVRCQFVFFCLLEPPQSLKQLLCIRSVQAQQLPVLLRPAPASASR